MDINFIDTKYRKIGSKEADVFSINNKYYYASLCHTPDHGNECMIFESKPDGTVIDYSELYCKRSIEVSRESLIECIKEFISGQGE